MADTGYDAGILDLSPTSYWKCQDSGSTIVEEIAANNGTWTGTLALVDPPAGHAGTPKLKQLEGLGEYGIVPDFAALDPDPAVDRWTMVAWLRPQGNSNLWHICRSHDAHADPYYCIAIGKVSGQHRIYVATEGSGGWPGGNPGATGVASNDNQLYHYALVYDDAATDSIVLYVDGVSVYTNNDRSGNPRSSSGGLGFGVIPALGTGLEAACDVAQVAWWRDRALTAGEVADLYALRDSATAGAAPVADDPPVIEGSAEVGSTLSLDTPGTYTGDAPDTVTYKWRKDGVDIPGETDETGYVTEDIGASITLRETATNDFGATTQDSNAIVVTDPAPGVTWAQVVIPARTIVIAGVTRTINPAVYTAERLSPDALAVHRSASTLAELVALCDAYDASL